MNEQFEMVNEDEIDLMDMLQVLWRRKWLIVTVIIIPMIVAFLFAIYQPSKLRTEKLISLSFDGINKGVYPDGSQFEKEDIISANILNKIDAQEGIETKIDLSNYLFVEAIVPEYIQEKIKKNPEVVYNPNRFKIVMVEPEKPLFPSNKVRNDIFEACVEQFKNYFQEQYVLEPVHLFQFSDKFVHTAEYDSIVYTFNKSIDSMESFLLQKINEAGNFRSRENGYSFSGLMVELSILKDVDLENVNSEIQVYNLAKNRDALVTSLQYEIKNIEYQNITNKKMAQQSFELLKTLRAGNTSAVEPSNTQLSIDSSILDEIKEKDYILHLITLNLEKTSELADAESDIARLTDRIKGLSSAQLKNKKTDKEIITQLKAIEDKLLSLSEKANNLNYEYLGLKYDNIIHTDSMLQQMTIYQVKPKLLLTLTFVGSLFFSLFLAFFVDYVIRYKKTRSDLKRF